MDEELMMSPRLAGVPGASEARDVSGMPCCWFWLFGTFAERRRQLSAGYTCKGGI